MNAHSMIPHRMFVAALSGGRHAPAPSAGPPLQVFVEPTAATAAVSLDEKRRGEAASALARRRILELGPHHGV